MVGGLVEYVLGCLKRCMLSVLFVNLLNPSIKAQECALPEHLIEEMYGIKVVRNNLDTIKSKAASYGVPADAIVYVLNYEYNDNGFKDWMQNYLASSRELWEYELRKLFELDGVMTLYGLAGTYDSPVKSGQTAFVRAYAYDQILRSQSEKPADGSARTGQDHWIFCSIGPGQIQPYFMAVMLKERRIKNASFYNEYVRSNGDYWFNKIAQHLRYPEVAIEVLAAELAWAQDVYWQRLGVKILDLESPCEIYKQLHRIGYFEYLAERRKQRTDIVCEDQRDP